MEAKIVGQKIAELRKKNNMTQKELAAKLSVIDKTVSRWECGYGLPDVTILPEIAAIFDVRIEELIGIEDSPVCAAEENGVSLSAEEGAAAILERRKFPKAAVPILFVSFFVVGLTTLLVWLFFPKQTAPKIGAYCWKQAENSSSDYVFFTAFGFEECMSLELNGSAEEGNFFCQETWQESASGDPFDCAVYGEYRISEEKIYFYPQEVVDPYGKKKLHTHTELGIDDFHADVIYGDDASIEALSFTDTVKNTDTSVFGRWTKFANYFSRSKGEIYFERVTDGFRYDQLLRMPEFVLVDMAAVVPYKLEVTLERYSYYVGEVIAPEDIKVLLVYADGSKKQVYNAVCEQAGRCLTDGDNCLNVYYTEEGIKKTATVAIAVSYGYAWDRARASKADYVYFTHYNTGESISFGSLELYGNSQKGRFIYSENYGVQSLSAASVVTGTYEHAEGELRFVSSYVFSYLNYLSKFYINAEGDYFTAYEENNFECVRFDTGEFSRNLFGHYTGEPNGTSFSKISGEVRFERVTDRKLSEKAQKAVDYYKNMHQ